MSYHDEDLPEIYRHYAELKGWSTKPQIIADKVATWTEQGIGAVGLAVDFYLTGKDGYKQVCHDAEKRFDAILEQGGRKAAELKRFFRLPNSRKDRELFETICDAILEQGGPKDPELFEITCGSCGYRLKTNRDNAGRTGRCSKCGTAVTVPLVPPTPFPETGVDNAKHLERNAERVAAESHGKVRHYTTYLAGVRHANSDGSSRDDLIAELKVNERLGLDSEEDNPHDSNAVKVLRTDGRQIGYLPRDVAADVVQKSERGFNFACFVAGLIEEDDGGHIVRFVDLLMIEADRTATDDEVQDYLRTGGGSHR